MPSSGTAQIEPTIHGDPWFFTDITQGAEITERRAQWIADGDLDRDGETNLDELRMAKAAEVFTPELGCSVTGASITVTTAYDDLAAQARTLGDFQGEGECPTRAPPVSQTRRSAIADAARRSNEEPLASAGAWAREAEVGASSHPRRRC